jgi:hypothetical protein
VEILKSSSNSPPRIKYSSHAKTIAMTWNLFNSNKFRFVFILPVFLFLSSTILAQEITVAGRVIDDSTKSPLSGVTVLIKGAGNKGGVVTTPDGTFSIKAPRGSTLTFSSVGFNNVEAVANSETVNVSLISKSGQLSDVVVIGYGSRQKKDLTGAYGVVGENEISKSTAVSPELALQGSLREYRFLHPVVILIPAQVCVSGA